MVPKTTYRCIEDTHVIETRLRRTTKKTYALMRRVIRLRRGQHVICLASFRESNVSILILLVDEEIVTVRELPDLERALSSCFIPL